MSKVSQVTNEELQKIRLELENTLKTKVRAWQIKDILATQGVHLDESTIRGRFIEMKMPLGVAPADAKSSLAPVQAAVQVKAETNTTVKEVRIIKPDKNFQIPDEMKQYIPNENLFNGYIEREIDKRLAVHYDSGKHPITQGKQGTGKTFSHMYYAFKNQLPFFLFSCYEDMKLKKYFGEKTIEQGTIKFKEGILVKAVQCPSVILWDEINAISNANSFDFHALLQNRELMVREANDGNGHIYKVHPQCRIGFAQNPKSAKYIGGNIKPSNFLGRCTFLTYPEFTKKEIVKFLKIRFPALTADESTKFVTFYFACDEAIKEADLPVDISIRQLNNVIDLYLHGLPLGDAIEDGLTSIMEAISQPKNKDAFQRLAQAVFADLMKKSVDENVGNLGAFILKAKKLLNS